MSTPVKLKVFYRKISDLFKGKHALLTNTVTGAALFIAGDVIRQGMEINKGISPGLDYSRIARIGIIGITEGPPHYYFYYYLDKFLPGKSFKTIGKKILCDQLIACPLFGIQFFCGMALLEGKNLTESWNEFTRKFPRVLMFDCFIWPPLQFINFYLVPKKFRVLYVNTATVCWNVFLSYMKHYVRDQHHKGRHSSS